MDQNKDKPKEIHIGVIGTSGHGKMGLFDQIDRAFEANIERMFGITDKEEIGKIKEKFTRAIDDEIINGSGDQWPKKNPIGLMAATGTCSNVKFDKKAFDELIEEALKAKVVARPHVTVKAGTLFVVDHEEARKELSCYPEDLRGKTIYFNYRDRKKLEPSFNELHIPIEEDRDHE